MGDIDKIIEQIDFYINRMNQGSREHFIDMQESESWNKYGEMFDIVNALLRKLKELDPELWEKKNNFFTEYIILKQDFAEREIRRNMNGNIKKAIQDDFKRIKELISSKIKLDPFEDKIVYGFIMAELQKTADELEHKVEIVEIFDPKMAETIRNKAKKILSEKTGQGDSEQGEENTAGSVGAISKEVR